MSELERVERLVWEDGEVGALGSWIRLVYRLEGEGIVRRIKAKGEVVSAAELELVRSELYSAEWDRLKAKRDRLADVLAQLPMVWEQHGMVTCWGYADQSDAYGITGAVSVPVRLNTAFRQISPLLRDAPAHLNMATAPMNRERGVRLYPVHQGDWDAYRREAKYRGMIYRDRQDGVRYAEMRLKWDRHVALEFAIGCAERVVEAWEGERDMWGELAAHFPEEAWKVTAGVGALRWALNKVIEARTRRGDSGPLLRFCTHESGVRAAGRDGHAAVEGALCNAVDALMPLHAKYPTRYPGKDIPAQKGLLDRVNCLRSFFNGSLTEVMLGVLRYTRVGIGTQRAQEDLLKQALCGVRKPRERSALLPDTEELLVFKKLYEGPKGRLKPIKSVIGPPGHPTPVQRDNGPVSAH